MPVVWSDRHRRHEPGGEVWVGVRTPAPSCPSGPSGCAPRSRTPARDSWMPNGTRTRPCSRSTTRRCSSTSRGLGGLGGGGADRGPGPGSRRPLPVPPSRTARPGSAAGAHCDHGRAGRFAYDTMTLIGPGTWDAARAAVDVALTAADLVLAGEPASYACCRPPGHHATRDCFGGSCYLNNAAAAAARLRAGAAAGSPCSTSTRTTGTAPRRSSTRIPRSWSALRTSTPPPGGFALPRLRGRDRRRSGRGRQPQPAARAGLGRRSLAGGGRGARRLGARRRVRALVVALESTRPPATRRAHCASAPTATAPPGACSAGSAYRPLSSRRAATTCGDRPARRRGARRDRGGPRRRGRAGGRSDRRRGLRAVEAKPVGGA